MATFVEIQTDAFANNVKVAKDTVNYDSVRRPYRGIEIKQDTYGVIKVMTAGGVQIPLVDAGGPITPKETNSTGAGTDAQEERTGHAATYNYSNFIIQQVQDSREEKQQILETFGDSYIFFFGERPRVLAVRGLLMNTLDFNWRSEFWHNYENVLRGTKLVERNARIYLYWDDIVVEGYMLGASAQDDASMPYHIPFSFQLFVTNHMYLSTIGDDDYPITHAVNLDEALRQTDVEGATRTLKSHTIAAAEYASNIDKVRRSLQASEQARLAAQEQGLSGFLGSSGGQKFMQGKNLLANALAVGVNAQNLTFLSVVNRAFRNRKMRFPRGIAGAESYSGPPQSATKRYPWGEGPKRSIPYRSKIKHNVDEYVRWADQGDAAARDWIQASQTSPKLYDLEQRALEDLYLAGIDPVQHPGGSPFGNSHSLGGFSGTVTEASLLAIGFSVSAGLSAAGVSGVGGLLP